MARQCSTGGRLSDGMTMAVLGRSRAAEATWNGFSSYCGHSHACKQYLALRSAAPKVGKPVARKSLVRSHAEPQVLDHVSRETCPAVKPEIDHSLFAGVDLRVGLITDAKPVLDSEMSEKRGKPTYSRRFLELTVDIGCEIRVVVSECKYVMDVEDAVGKKVLVVANVPRVEILGIISHGLILTGFNYDPTPMPRSFKVILPGLGRLPPGSQVAEAAVPK